MKLSETKKGDVFILSGGVLWALFPIVTILTYSSVGPLTSLTFGTIFSATFFAMVITINKKWQELMDPAVWKDIFIIALFIGVLVYVFMFLGLKNTSPANASLIGLTEIFFSYLLFNVWKREKFSAKQIVGSLLMILGAAIILYPKNTHFHSGDLFILLANVVAPVGNYFQQRIRKKISSVSILFGRNIITIPIVFALALLFREEIAAAGLKESFWFLVLNGAILFGLSKIFWIEGIHRISVTKANALSSFTPLFTMLFAYLILNQIPTPTQITAFIPLFIGFLLLTYSSGFEFSRSVQR